MTNSKRPMGRPRTSDQVTFSIKIPRKLQATLDTAASNSWDSQNHDFTPLDYANSIDFSAPATRPTHGTIC